MLIYDCCCFWISFCSIHVGFYPFKIFQKVFSSNLEKKVSNYVRSSIISQWNVSPELGTLVRVNWQKLIVN